MSRPRKRLLAVAAVALMLTSAGWLQYTLMNDAAPVPAEISVMVQKASAVVSSALLSGLSAVSQSLGLGRVVMSDAVREPIPAAEAVPPVVAPRRRQAPRSPSDPLRTQSPSILTDAASTPVESDALASLLPLSDRDERVAEVVLPPADLNDASPVPQRDFAGDDAADPTAIYSAESTEVLPPVGIRPQLPSDLPADVRREDLVSIEVVVLSDGTVDSVRLLSEAQNVHDLMWLSAVKAWQFRPAVKDGRAVAYRKTVWIAPQ